jgi:hypothetical protein
LLNDDLAKSLKNPSSDKNLGKHKKLGNTAKRRLSKESTLELAHVISHFQKNDEQIRIISNLLPPMLEKKT